MNTNYLPMNKTYGNSNLHYYHSSSKRLGSRMPILLWFISWAFLHPYSNHKWLQSLVHKIKFAPLAPSWCAPSKISMKTRASIRLHYSSLQPLQH